MQTTTMNNSLSAILLLLWFSFVFGFSMNAQIAPASQCSLEEVSDEFTGSKSYKVDVVNFVKSYQKYNINLYKTIDNGNDTLVFCIITYYPDKPSLIESGAEILIKVDSTIYKTNNLDKLKVSEVESSKYGSHFKSTVVFKLDKKLIASILNSQYLKVRITESNSFKDIEVPVVSETQKGTFSDGGSFYKNVKSALICLLGY